MKTVLITISLVALAASGCWPHAPFTLVPEPTPEPSAAVAVLPPRPPVTPEQVKVGNAHEMAEALLEEIDREQAEKAK